MGQKLEEEKAEYSPEDFKGLNKDFVSRAHALHLELKHSSTKKYMVTRCNHFDGRK